MMIMYCSAIFYFVDNMSKSTQLIVKANPLFGIINNFRRALFGQPFDMTLLTYTSVISVAALLIGMFVFYKKSGCVHFEHSSQEEENMAKKQLAMKVDMSV